MIINSKFKDYYDSIAHQYRDPKVVYNRHSEEIEYNSDPSLKTFVDTYTWGYLNLQYNPFKISGGCNVLLIGGKPYPFTNANDEDSGSHPDWDFKNPYAYLDKCIQDDKFNRRFYLDRGRLETGILNDECVDLCQRIAPIILIWGGKTWVHDRRKVPNVKIELNPKIHDLKPPISPWEVYQDLMSVLAANEPHIPEMSNEEKIAAHGYDKVSFRPTMRK